MLFFVNRANAYVLFAWLFLYLNALHVMAILSECYSSIIMQRRLVGVIHHKNVVLFSDIVVSITSLSYCPETFFTSQHHYTLTVAALNNRDLYCFIHYADVDLNSKFECLNSFYLNPVC